MVSSKDVAKLAGVSQSTVSRVLNNPDNVKVQNREKVLRAMEQLGYYPNLIARSLVTKSTRTIALISGTLNNGFYVEATESIVHLAKKRGYNTIVYFEDEQEIPDFFESVMGYKVDGVLLSLINLDDPVVERLRQSKLPHVFFNRRPRTGGNYVTLDNITAAQLLTKHLLDLGHRRIAFVSGTNNVSTFHERQLGFENSLRSADVEISPELVHNINPSKQEVEKVTNHLLQLPTRPTAIVCATDSMALACMNVILEKGLRIPDDISIAGFDNIGITSHRSIQLTTVGNEGESMGELAANALIDMLENSGAHNGKNNEVIIQRVLRPKLVVRKTTGKVKR